MSTPRSASPKPMDDPQPTELPCSRRWHGGLTNGLWLSQLTVRPISAAAVHRQCTIGFECTAALHCRTASNHGTERHGGGGGGGGGGGMLSLRLFGFRPSNLSGLPSNESGGDSQAALRTLWMHDVTFFHW